MANKLNNKKTGGKKNTTINNIGDGVKELRRYAENPANREMFDAIVNGDVGIDVVDPMYIVHDFKFDSINELNYACRVLTRNKIQAFKGDIDGSVLKLTADVVNSIKVNDKPAVVVNEILDVIDDGLNEPTDEMITRVIIMIFIRVTLMTALDENLGGLNIRTVANESVVTVDAEKVDEIPKKKEPTPKIVEVSNDSVTVVDDKESNTKEESDKKNVNDSDINELHKEVKKLMDEDDYIRDMVEKMMKGGANMDDEDTIKFILLSAKIKSKRDTTDKSKKNSIIPIKSSEQKKPQKRLDDMNTCERLDHARRRASSFENASPKAKDILGEVFAGIAKYL